MTEKLRPNSDIWPKILSKKYIQKRTTPYSAHNSCETVVELTSKKEQKSIKN